MTSEIIDIVSFFYNRYKRENSFKLLARIRQYYVGISKDKIQSFIKKNCEHCLHNPIFSNKENLKPVIATKKPMVAQISCNVTEVLNFKVQDFISSQFCSLSTEIQECL